MKISFSEKLTKLDGSGKHKFLYRLSLALRQQGVEVGNDSDIHLLIPGGSVKKNRINVLRLDGLLFNNKFNYRDKNEKIIKLVRKSDAVVFQNQFCRDAYANFLRLTPRRSTCILNGADPKEFLPRRPGKFFLANCRWRPHKRLAAIVESYLLAREKGLSSRLVVAGEADFYRQDGNIDYIGWQTSSNLCKLMSQALATLHLSWIDWCPNSMVESIVSGCPTIYTNSGGQPYLADRCGIAIEDTAWNFKACDHYNPPVLNYEQVAKAMLQIERSPYNVSNIDLIIDNIASQYLSFFESLL